MSKYPIYLELADKRAVVVGAGPVATRKAKAIHSAGARLVVVARRVTEPMLALSTSARVELIRAKYAKEYLVNSLIVVAATSDNAVNQQVYKDCQQLGILCNVVDNPHLCDFFIPAVLKRGDLQITIGTEGACPAFAGHMRKKLEKIFTDQHGRFVSELQNIRKTLFDTILDPDRRKILMGKLVNDQSYDYFVTNGPDAWRKRAQYLIENSTPHE